MSVVEMRTWIAVGTFLVTILVASVAFGEDYGPCYLAYRSSGLTQQQMTFDEFGELYSDTICA